MINALIFKFKPTVCTVYAALILGIAAGKPINVRTYFGTFYFNNKNDILNVQINIYFTYESV